MKNGNNETGYGKPPQHAQFQKGSSGNPKGRPKGKPNLATVLEKTLREKVIVNENGRRKTITKLEAAMKQLINKAAAGDLRALHQLLTLARSAEERTGETTPTTSMTETDRDVLQGILNRVGTDVRGGGDAESSDE
jgi:hypothetical protein